MDYINEWISTSIAVVVAFITALWKLFSLKKDIELLKQRIELMEQQHKVLNEEITNVENRILSNLIRIETKLDHFILKDR